MIGSSVAASETWTHNNNPGGGPRVRPGWAQGEPRGVLGWAQRPTGLVR